MSLWELGYHDREHINQVISLWLVNSVGLVDSTNTKEL